MEEVTLYIVYGNGCCLYATTKDRALEIMAQWQRVRRVSMVGIANDRFIEIDKGFADLRDANFLYYSPKEDVEKRSAREQEEKLLVEEQMRIGRRQVSLLEHLASIHEKNSKPKPLPGDEWKQTGDEE